MCVVVVVWVGGEGCGWGGGAREQLKIILHDRNLTLNSDAVLNDKHGCVKY